MRKLTLLTSLCFALSPVAANAVSTIVFGTNADGMAIDPTAAFGDIYSNLAGTPNVTVSWNSALDLTNWGTQYGDLSSVAYASTGGTNAGDIIITFTAAPGWRVLLNSFDLAHFGAGAVIPNVSVTGGAPLFSVNNPSIAGGFPPGSHTTFSPAVLSSNGGSISIVVDTGAAGENIGIDNINFDQVAVIPEPASAVLAMVGFLAILRRRK